MTKTYEEMIEWATKKVFDGIIKGEPIRDAIAHIINHTSEWGADNVDRNRQAIIDKLNAGWDCDESPTGKCVYDNGDPDHCDYCGDPEERK